MIDPGVLPYKVAALLNSQKIHASRGGYPVRAPQVYTFGLEVDPKQMPQALRQSEAITAALDSSPPARVYQEGRWLMVEVPRKDRDVVMLERMQANGWCVELGIDPLGRRVTINLAETPHGLVAGQTGSGKSVAMRTLAWGLAQSPDAIELVLVDTDADTWQPLEQADSLRHSVVSDPDQVDAALDAVMQEMELRLTTGAWQRRLIVMIDEVQTLSSRARESVKQLATRGRKAGCHVIVATQYVRSDVLDRRLTDQLALRILGRMQDGVAGYWAGSADVAALMGHGDMLVSQSGRLARCQVAYAAANERAWNLVPRTDTVPPVPQPIATEVHESQQRADDHEAIAWAMVNGDEEGQAASARQIRKHLSCGTDRARRIRDDAQAALDMQERVTGVTGLLRVTDHPRWPGIRQTG